MTQIPRPEHPQPQMKREHLKNLNGEWDKVLIADSTQITFRAEGHQDLLLPICLSFLPFLIYAAASKVKGKIPFSIQVFPMLPLHLGLGMLRSGYLCHNFVLL